MFKGNPLQFVRRRVVDNLQMTTNPSPTDVAHGQLRDMLKLGNFDFTGAALTWTVPFKPVTSGVLGNEAPITAYWCPYKIGQEPPGYVDVPRRNPAYDFVFTGAMNGCAFVVTNSAKGGNFFRLYHLHNAGTVSNWNMFANMQIITILTYDDYGYANNEGSMDRISTSFNFLYYRFGKWNIISQPQFIIPSHDPATQSVRFGFKRPFDIPVDV
jgi:hypothetical protein